MKLPIIRTTLAVMFIFSSALLLAQSSSVQDHNSSRSNKSSISLPNSGWNFGAGAGGSFATKSNEASMFRGTGFSSNMFGEYNFGKVGLGLLTGFASGTISSSALNSFLAERKLPPDATVKSSNPLNAYFLLGPSFHFGQKVDIQANVCGGIFYNHAGSVAVAQPGATRAIYRMEAGDKSMFPGFSGNIQIAYPINPSTRFFINSSYLQSQTAVRILDPQQGIDVATEQNRSLKLFTAGLGIIKSFNAPRDRQTGMATGRRSHNAYRDVPSGMATGKRSAPSLGQPTGKRIVSPRDPASGMATGKRFKATPGNTTNANENCGPVTLKKTNPDGSVEESTFSCPNDAANYARQSQGQTFGEKVSSGLQSGANAVTQGNNIIAGTISWSSASSAGIVTNKKKKLSGMKNHGGATSSSYALGTTDNNNDNPIGMSAAIYSRDAASGQATGKRSGGNGLATGRRQWSTLYVENENDSTAKNRVVNPLYNGNTSGNNPIYNGTTKNAANCNGVAAVKVYLLDVSSGTAIASTETEDCGEFYFANVPDGKYAIRLSGQVSAEKNYDIQVPNQGNQDVAGELLLAPDYWSMEILTTQGTPEEAAAVIKTKTKSNQSNDRQSKPVNSYIKNLPVSITDEDEDGVSEIWIGNAATQSDLLGGTVSGAALRPGNPIGGIIVKGGKNPGGSFFTTTTNEYGEFEFTGFTPGQYQIGTTLHYLIADETIIGVGNADSDSGYAPTTSKSRIGDMPNRISMNVTTPKQTQGATFGEKVNSGMNQAGTKAQNNNTVRSNRIGNALILADLDGDGQPESSVISFNSEVASITIPAAAGTSSKVVEKATSGLKDVLKTNVRMAGNNGPVKWQAPELNAKGVNGDPHVNEKDGTLRFESSQTTIGKGNWATEKIDIKAITFSDGSCAIITAKPNDFPASTSKSLSTLQNGTPVAGAEIWFTDSKGNTYTGVTNSQGKISLNALPKGEPIGMHMNLQCDGESDILVTFNIDASGNAISNVLKTKHDTAKNSISNVR